MAKQYDAALKNLIDRFAADWATFLCAQLGLPAGTRAEPLDPDLSTVSPQADKAFRLLGNAKGFIHLELQSSWDGTLEDRLLLYSVLLEHRYGGPVQTVVILLRREAFASNLTGVLARSASGSEYLRFTYRVMKLWELPSEPFMAGPLGTTALGLLTDAAQPMLPQLIHQLDERLNREAPSQKEADEVLTTCSILLGLRYDKSEVARLFHGVGHMRESSTYQAILEEGAVNGMRRVLRRLGQQLFGAPTPETENALNAITDAARLERMIDRLQAAADWNDLLATP